MDYRSLPAISSIYEIEGSDDPHNIYTMNEGDEFSVIIKNKNTTMATIIYNAITFGLSGNNNTKIYVNYGGTVKAETYRNKKVDDDIKNYNTETTDPNISSLVNSYISNGLVVLLNGEYNSGATHSNTTNVWSDLSGNLNNAALSNFDFNDESGWRFDGLHFTGKEYVGISDLDFDEMTLEVVVRFDSITDTNNPTQSVLSNINSGGAGIIFNQLNSTDVSKRGKISFDIYTEDENGNVSATPSSVVGNDVIQANKVYSISASFGRVDLDTDESGMAYESFVQLLGINGNVDGKDFSGTYYKPATGSNFIIGGNPLAGVGANTQFKGTIYSVRIYNRALTEEEIKQNYEIDKQKYSIE